MHSINNSKYQPQYGSEVNSVLSSKPDLLIRCGNVLVVGLIIAIVIAGLIWPIPQTVSISAHLISEQQKPLSPQSESSTKYIMLKIQKIDFEKIKQTGQHTIKIKQTSGDASNNIVAGIISEKKDSLGSVFLRVYLTEPMKTDFDNSLPLSIQISDSRRKRSLFSHLLSGKR